MVLPNMGLLVFWEVFAIPFVAIYSFPVVRRLLVKKTPSQLNTFILNASYTFTTMNVID